MRKEFICTQDALHQSMLNSPWPILLYVASVFFIMFLVQRAANVPHRATAAKNLIRTTARNNDAPLCCAFALLLASPAAALQIDRIGPKIPHPWGISFHCC